MWEKGSISLWEEYKYSSDEVPSALCRWEINQRIPVGPDVGGNPDMSSPERSSKENIWWDNNF